MEIFQLTKRFPAEERYSLTDQIRRASRSVCYNIGEAWRKRRYKAAFVAKLSDAEGEACETQVELLVASRCGYIDQPTFDRLWDVYEHILAQITKMIDGADQWTIRPAVDSPRRRVAASPRRSSATQESYTC